MLQHSLFSFGFGLHGFFRCLGCSDTLQVLLARLSSFHEWSCHESVSSSLWRSLETSILHITWSNDEFFCWWILEEMEFLWSFVFCFCFYFFEWLQHWDENTMKKLKFPCIFILCHIIAYWTFSFPRFI